MGALNSIPPFPSKFEFLGHGMIKASKLVFFFLSHLVGLQHLSFVVKILGNTVSHFRLLPAKQGRHFCNFGAYFDDDSGRHVRIKIELRPGCYKIFDMATMGSFLQ